MAPKLTNKKAAFVSRSKALATDYQIYVADPGERSTAGALPAVVIFDGDYFFDPAVAAYRALRAKRAVPPMLMVGVGYGKPFGDPENRRGRDYTPTASSEEPGSGGAREFLEYLSSELWPTLTKRHSIDGEQSVLAGHSLSALFVLYAAFQSQPILRRAIIGAPSIWWDNRSVLAHLSRLRDVQDRLPAELYVGVGTEETPSMLGDLSLFDAQLRARPFADLRITTQRFPDRDHYNLVPDLFAGGLSHLFGGKR